MMITLLALVDPAASLSEFLTRLGWACAAVPVAILVLGICGVPQRKDSEDDDARR